MTDTIIRYSQLFFTSIWKTLCQMSPYLLFGFLMAGILSVLISKKFVEKHLGGKGMLPVLKASLLGIPIPLCSCGVVPLATSLKKQGASKGATIGFLISTPQTGIDSISVTLSLLGPIFACFRPIAALVSGIMGGFLVSFLPNDKKQKVENCSCCKTEQSCCSKKKKQSIIAKIFLYGFITLPKDISKSLILGIFIAGIISIFIPDDYFAKSFGDGIMGMFAMILFGIPLYVCATASVPIASALILKGISPGAALVFLMTGPATNAATITTIWKIMGKASACIYVLSVAATAILSGIILNSLFEINKGGKHLHQHQMGISYGEMGSAIILIVILLIACFYKKKE